MKAAKALKENGDTPEELLRSIKENEKAEAEAEKEVAAWKAIAGEKSRREEAAKAEAERIATEKAEAERKAAEERERAEAEEKARIEAEKKEAERIAAEKAEEERVAKQKTAETESAKEEAEKRMDDEEPKPVGSGVFGNIYNQFKGKVKEAFDFLMKHKGGDLLGVFHRKDVGDIDLVWGDHGGGLAHIIRRHIIEQNDFKNVDEIQKVIEDVIRNGLIVRENKDKINIEYNGYRVSIKKTIRDSKGNVVENKNWIVTAFDKSKPKHEKRNPSSSETLTTPSANQKADGVTLPSNEDSTGKGSEKPRKKQEKQSVFDKAKEIADKEEKKRKAEAEDDSALGQATRAVGKKKKVNLFKYTASKIISHPMLRGVHYANGYAYASDAYIIFKEKADYPKEWEGTTRDKDGNLVDGEYPDAEKAIHGFVYIPDKEVESLPSKEVLDFAIAASKKMKGEAIPVAIDGIFFNAVNLKKFLEAVASKGMDKVVYRHPMLYATNGKDEIVMMSIVNTLEGALNIADRMEIADLPKEQIDAWKAHIEAADKKMSFDDFKKAVENAKKEGVRPTETERPKQKELTEAERKDAEEVAGALGYRVEWVDTMEENGTIDADKKVIRIAKDAENPLVQVLGHEVAHGVKRMDGGKFRALQKAAKEVIGEKEWNERIEKKRKLNAYAEGKLAEEVTCDIVGEALNNKDALKRLAESLRGEKGILARLRDAVAKMVEYFKNRGDKEGVRRMKAADKLLAEFESALKEGEGVNRSAREAENENVDRSERENRSEKTELTAEERELRDNLVERMRKGGLDVVTDSEEMQRVIDTENERTRNKRSKKSEAARKRDEALYAVDWSTAFVSGKSREEATEIRRERGRKFKEETKELYGRVLSGNFDDVTLRLIDEFIDKSTPNNPYERPISKRLPTRALQKMRGGERTGSVDALFSRICESAVGKDGKALPRAERKRAIEEKKKELLKKWAIATGNWHTDVSDFSDGKEPIGSGTDSDVYLSKDGKSVIKVSKGKPYGKRFRPDVDNVALFNTVFPGSRYTIEGYGEIDGKFVRFLKQPFVDFSDSTPLTEGERVAYMEKLGFKPINKENTAFSNGEIIASDLQKSNIVKDKQGNVRVIDADMKLHTKDFGGKFSYPDAETDTRTDGMQRFLRTADGEVYGLVKDGRIYLDPKVATSETAVHEYTHLWGDMLRRKDAEQWSRTVKELKNSVLWEEVKELYPELKTDDEIADEVLSTFSGRRGAERLREEARRVADGEGGVFTKAKAIETLERVKEAIARFWEGVAKMFGINRYRSAEELADMAMKDLLDSKNPMKDESGMRKRGEVGETLATSGTYFSGGGLLEAGLKGVIDPKVADRVSQNLEERTRAMGSRVEKRMADVAQKLEGKELSMEQKAVVDVFSGKSDNQKFSVEREDGKKVSVVVRKGTETSAGTKHSLYRHYNTNVGTITTDDILLIPQIIKEGEIKRIRKGNEQYVEYTQKIGDKKLTTLMQIVNGKEVFNNFYSNKKGSELPASRNAESIDNTPEGAHNINSEPSAKVEDKSESPKLFGEEIIDDGKKGSDSIDRSVRENPKSEDKPRLSRKPGESIFDYASRVSDSVDRSVRERVSARDEYEKKVKSKGFQTKEALQNSMLGLQEFMFAIDHASGNKRYIEDIPDFENPILGENRLSSVNKEEMHQVAKTQFKPLMSAVAKLSGNGKESGELYDYMFAKHGLERDAVMWQREAQKEFDKYQKANPKGPKTIEDFVASLEGKDYAGLTALTAEDGRVKSIQSQIDAIDEQMKATDDQLLLRYLGGQKKRLKVDLLNAARDAADDIRKAFESNPSHDRSDINELWKRVNEVNGNTLRKLYESGLLTKEAYNDINSMYTHYIPMRGFDQTTSADAYAYLTHNDSAEPRNT